MWNDAQRVLKYHPQGIDQQKSVRPFFDQAVEYILIENFNSSFYLNVCFQGHRPHCEDDSFTC